MESPQLAALQRRLSAWIRDPETIAGGARPEPHAGRPADLVCGDARASAAVRLGVYATGFQARIREALARDFPVLAARVGGDGFHDLILLYLLACPPRRPSLRFAGARLAGFLAGHPAAAPFRSRWPFAADLARLEWALSEAFDAPDADRLGREDLQCLPASAFEHLELFLHPSAARLCLDWPVQHLLAAAASLPTAWPPLAAGRTEVLVWRPDEEPRFRVLPPDEARALDAVGRGTSFGALCERLASDLGADAAPGRAAALLAAWTGDGVLRSPA